MKLRHALPVILLVIFVLLQFTGLFTGLDNLLHDTILSGERTPSPEIVIVGIDERSINEIGIWPWPRFYMADAIGKLTQAGAAAIGVNVLYDTYSEDEQSDEALVTAASRTDRLVLAGNGVFPANLGEDQAFDELARVTSTGFFNVLPDESDGVLRKAFTAFGYNDITVRSLPYEVYRTYCRSMGITPNEIPLDAMGEFPVDYTARPGGYLELSLWGVLNDEYRPEMFRDKIVLIGPYAPGIGQDFPTPLDKNQGTYSVEIYANVIQNMLEGDIKSEAPQLANIAVMVALAALSIFIAMRQKPAVAAVAFLLAIAAQLGGMLLAYAAFGVIIDSGAAVLFQIACYAMYLIINIYAARHERNYIHDLFGRFVAPEVVNELVAGNVAIELGGVEKELTLLFVDIRGFTAFSEANPPDRVVAIINRYLSLTSRAIQEYGGTIDKFIGDATMAVFNAPNDLDDHALRAVRAAFAMKKGSVALREEILRDYGVDLQFGIGINTGPAVVGNMGSAFRMDYTAIGDTVNTAARLESNAQKGQILLSEATYSRVKEHVEVEDLGVLNVKNKKIGIQIYSLENIRD